MTFSHSRTKARAQGPPILAVCTGTNYLRAPRCGFFRLVWPSGVAESAGDRQELGRASHNCLASAMSSSAASPNDFGPGGIATPSCVRAPPMGLRNRTGAPGMRCRALVQRGDGRFQQLRPRAKRSAAGIPTDEGSSQHLLAGFQTLHNRRIAGLNLQRVAIGGARGSVLPLGRSASPSPASASRRLPGRAGGHRERLRPIAAAGRTRAATGPRVSHCRIGRQIRHCPRQLGLGLPGVASLAQRGRQLDARLGPVHGCVRRPDAIERPMIRGDRVVDPAATRIHFGKPHIGGPAGGAIAEHFAQVNAGFVQALPCARASARPRR